MRTTSSEKNGVNTDQHENLPFLHAQEVVNPATLAALSSKTAAAFYHGQLVVRPTAAATATTDASAFSSWTKLQPALCETQRWRFILQNPSIHLLDRHTEPLVARWKTRRELWAAQRS